MINYQEKPVPYFKKEAKKLLKDVNASNEFALFRINAALNDSTNFSLMKAQHVIAKEHGFQKWDNLLDATAIQQRLAITMKEEPALNAIGISFPFDSSLSLSQRQVKFKEAREELKNSFPEIDKIASWFQDNIVPIKTIDRSRTSYRLKHIVERQIGYITNGQFIAAAIICGYPYKAIYGSPNVYFGMSKKSFSHYR